MGLYEITFYEISLLDFSSIFIARFFSFIR